MANEDASSPYDEVENGILTMVISLYEQVRAHSGSSEYAKQYVRSYLTHIHDNILALETQGEEQKES